MVIGYEARCPVMLMQPSLCRSSAPVETWTSVNGFVGERSHHLLSTAIVMSPLLAR